jgi:hypothetical protein
MRGVRVDEIGCGDRTSQRMVDPSVVLSTSNHRQREADYELNPVKGVGALEGRKLYEGRDHQW